LHLEPTLQVAKILGTVSVSDESSIRPSHAGVREPMTE